MPNTLTRIRTQEVRSLATPGRIVNVMMTLGRFEAACQVSESRDPNVPQIRCPGLGYRGRLRHLGSILSVVPVVRAMHEGPRLMARLWSRGRAGVRRTGCWSGGRAWCRRTGCWSRGRAGVRRTGPW
jgi:hypothetical protein